MVRRSTLVPALALIASYTLTACFGEARAPTGITPPSDALLNTSGSASGNRYIVVGANNRLPSDLAARVAAAGGTLVKSHAQIGVAVVTGDATVAAAVAGISGVEAVARNLVFEQPAPRGVVNLADVTADVASTADNDRFYPLQWAPGAVKAPEAWSATPMGYRGAGVRVAILDGGLFDAHLDLVGGVDVERSKSFACLPPPSTDPPGTACTPTPFNSDVGNFWHGTHVAGIVGARDNAIGVVGIAPSATLIGVKVLHNGDGTFEWLVDGIMYAATPIAEGGAGAQIINMSLGALIPIRPPEANTPELLKQYWREVWDLYKVVSRATAYALSRGVLPIASAGNDGLRLGREQVAFPVNNFGVVGVAATAPFGWAASGNTEFHGKASYTNFGLGIDFAAPGGDADYDPAGTEICTVNTASPVIPITAPCWVFDMYLSTSREGYSWAAGTSMASPVVAGVAALIIEKYGRLMTPAGVVSRLNSGATDYGTRGWDAVYGGGFVNAKKSLNLR
jgi:lantibiotic leader peptide-processing serine protease